MTGRWIRCPAFAIVVALAFPACVFHSTGTRSEDRQGERVVTAEQVRATGATTAWEVMKRTLRGISFNDDRQGNPKRLSVRGSSSIHLADQPSIFIDGVRVTDFRRLDQMPASDIAEIRYLDGLTGTTRYGTNSGDGVILIYTWNGGSGV